MRDSLLCSIISFGLLANVVCGQDKPGDDVHPLLRQAIENRKKTLGEAQNYTYTEQYRSLTFDSNGAEKLKFTDTFEIIFLEGAPYKKHVLHNQQPLSQKEQKKEDLNLADVAKARREHKSRGLFHATFEATLPLDQLATRFHVAPQSSEDIDGRPTLIFTAVPAEPGDEALQRAARDGTAYRMKLWVDRQDGVFIKIESEVIAAGMRFEKGTLMTYEFKKVNREAWLPSRFWFKGKVRYMRSDVPAIAEQTYSGYQKFHAESKIVAQ